MKRTIYLAVICLGWFWAGISQGAEIKGLYEAEIPVVDTGTDTRQEAIRLGLAQVLVKISGVSRVTQEPALAELIGNASRYVQQYRYLDLDPAAQNQSGVGRELAEGSETLLPTRLLWMRFDEAILNQHLRAQRLPIWGEARPLLLTWLSVEEGGRRLLVSATDAGLARQLLELRAKERGVPLRLPLLDLHDQSMVSPADIWGGFHDTVLEASKRYQSQAVLIGRLYRDRFQTWHSQWTLYLGDETLRWNISGQEPAPVLQAGIDGSADAMSQRFAQAASGDEAGMLTLQIDGVNDVMGVTRVVEYLASVSGVSQVLVSEVGPMALRCRLRLSAETDKVIRTIALGETLSTVAMPLPLTGQEGGLENTRHYRLIP